MVTVVDFVEGVAQTNGVDLPAPVGSLQVGVLLSGNDVAAHILDILMGGDAVGHIIAEGVEVHRAFFQDVSVLGLLQDGDAVLGEPALHIAGILAAHLHIGAEPVSDLHLLLVGDHIGRVTGQRIAGDKADHVAHLELGIVVVGILDRLGASHELVMKCLKTLLLVVGHIGGGAFKAFDRAGFEDRAHGHGAAVDLVEGQPVLDLILVPLKNGLAVVHIELDEFPAGPAVVFFHQRIGQLVVTDGNQRLDAVLLAAVKDLVIEFKALLVRLGLHTGGENAGPVDGGAEGLEAHLGEESNVLLVVVVEVDGLMAGIQPVGADSSCHPFRAGVRAIGAQVRDTGAFAIHVPCALELVGCTGTAPQEIITENAHKFLLLSYFVLVQAGFCSKNSFRAPIRLASLP